ncbi:hypothetical protein LOTGIDRAFT_110519 [Lottia gigantea]|uniref:CS domain-containing protein n=1 Tax=Lottia gigantea TaxID=225164 RepID=V4BDP8_LOTGI|nr:hypothetical protein LOTGIDRAFT_110519 [Lottia gigantea]ESP03847.1 hypothetical protein LOTGIDRAFT_110519 [Lottia gigantea]
MAGSVDQYDAALLGILQNEGNISNFLQVMFGFLFRRTDFYLIMKGENDKLGFPQGMADKLVLQVRKLNSNQSITETVKTEDPSQQASSSKTSSDINEVEIETLPGTSESNAPQNVGGSRTIPADSAVTSDIPSREPHPEQQQVYQANAESYNGAVRENFAWSQSITDIDVRVNVHKCITKGKQCIVSIDKKHIKVGYKDSDNDTVILLDDNLTWEIQKEESIWSLVPGEHIHINLEKKEERWWESLVVSEPKINVRKIDCSRPMTDLDQEAQSKIGEMMFNEQQKRLGLPQSHEQKTYDMMKQAWDAEGSPFKGQPFDASKLSVNSGGVVSINE